MDSFIQRTFKKIEDTEKRAYERYSKIIQKCSNPDIINQLNFIANQELAHQKFIQSIDLSNLSFILKGDISDVNYDIKIKPENSDELNGMLDLAIWEEENAEFNYNLVAENIADGEIKEKLKTIAKQEEYHKKIILQIKNAL